MFSETAYSSQTKLIGLNLPIGEHRIGYSNLTPDPQGARGKIQVSSNQKTLLTEVVRHYQGIVKTASAPPEELGHTHEADVSKHDFKIITQWLVFIASTYEKCLGVKGGIRINTHFRALVLIWVDS